MVQVLTSIKRRLRSKHNWRFIKAICVFSIAVIILVSYIGYLWTYYSFFPLVPLQKKTAYPINLVYPPITSGPLQPTLFQINFTLQASNTLAEGVNIRAINVKGNLYSPIEFNTGNFSGISEIIVGFLDANPNPPYAKTISIRNETIGPNKTIQTPQTFYTNLAFIDLVPIEPTVAIASHVDPSTLEVDYNWMNFNFPVAGDYSPSIIMIFQNQTISNNILSSNETALTYTYDQIKLHVISTSELQTQQINLIGSFVGVALLVFAYVELWKLLHEWAEKGSKNSHLPNNDESENELGISY